VSRRELANRAAGTVLTAGFVGQGLNLAADTAQATTQGDATFQNTEPYILDKQNEVTVVSRLDCLDSKYVSGDDTYNHKFDFAHQAACRHKDDKSDKRYNIEGHEVRANNNGSDLRWATYSDPTVTGAVPPDGTSDEDMTLVKDAIEVAASTTENAVEKALSAATIFADMVAAATESFEEDPDRWRFGWAYENAKSDVSHQAKFWASHDASKAPDFTLDAQAASVYNRFYVKLGDDADTYKGSFGNELRSDQQGPPEGVSAKPMPRPPNLSKKEKKKYSVQLVTSQDADLPEEKTQKGPVWKIENYPMIIQNVTGD